MATDILQLLHNANWRGCSWWGCGGCRPRPLRWSCPRRGCRWGRGWCRRGRCRGRGAASRRGPRPPPATLYIQEILLLLDTSFNYLESSSDSINQENKICSNFVGVHLNCCWELRRPAATCCWLLTLSFCTFFILQHEQTLGTHCQHKLQPGPYIIHILMFLSAYSPPHPNSINFRAALAPDFIIGPLCLLELQTIHQFSQSRRWPLLGHSPGWKHLQVLSHLWREIWTPTQRS